MIAGWLLGLAAALQAPPATCPAIPGSDLVLDDTRATWIVVGEFHGTAETPQAFGDLVCLAAAKSSHIVVAIEHSTTEQAGIDAFLRSDGGVAARTALLSAPAWHDATQDGRTSEAMLNLFDRLRRLSQSGAIVRVVTFLPDHASSAADHEREMAATVRDAASEGKFRVLVLVGNTHAHLTPVRNANGSYDAMAALLPRDRTVTLQATGNAGGTAWMCVTAADGKLACGPTATPQPPSKSFPRSIALRRDPDWTYTGWLNLGAPTTASPPAVPAP